MNLSRAFFAAVVASLVASVAIAAADRWAGAPVDGTVGGMVVPAQTFAAITPHNTTDIATGVPRAIYSHDGGDVACVDRLGTEMVVLFAAGEIKPLRCVRVNATATNSTVIYALY